jgi:hypothetical protein
VVDVPSTTFRNVASDRSRDNSKKQRSVRTQANAPILELLNVVDGP